MPRFVVKGRKPYFGGLGVDEKVHATAELALEAAVELNRVKPLSTRVKTKNVGYEVVEYKPYPACSVCGGPHPDEKHTPNNV